MLCELIVIGQCGHVETHLNIGCDQVFSSLTCCILGVYIRLESSIGAVDEVPVTDFLHNQQGTGLMALRGTDSYEE